MPKERSLVLALVLSFVPFGIFYSGFTAGLIVYTLDVFLFIFLMLPGSAGFMEGSEQASEASVSLLVLGGFGQFVIHILIPIIYIRRHNARVEAYLTNTIESVK